MAEIHLQKKRKNIWWLWLLIILFALAVVYYLYTNNYFNDDNLNAIRNKSANILDSMVNLKLI